MMRRVIVLVIALGCGGGKGSTPDAATTHDAPVDAPRPAEANCFDGLDDNGDGLADCADPTCAAVATCVAEVPADWTGYDHLFDGSGAAPACPSLFAQSATPGNSGLTADPASCGACACGAPANLTCDMPDAMFVQDATCGNAGNFVTQLSVPAAWDGTCTGTDFAPGGRNTCGNNGTSPCNAAVLADAPVVTGGSCGASGGASTVTPSSFTGAGFACAGAPHGGGCTGTEVCQPKPAAPFESGICIHHDGDVACPVGTPFTARHVFYTGVDDTRGCSACACGAPAGATCSATISVYASGSSCTGTPAATFAAGTCTNLAGNPQITVRKATITAPTGGACPASGGAATGSATGTGATTYCCIP
jgi:hypothetical protein